MSHMEAIAKELGELCKPARKPKVGQQYWYAYEHILPTDGGVYIVSRLWTDSILDYMNLKTGNYFDTRKEAEANSKRIYKELTGKKWGE